jgi:hypothetical protein
VYLEEVIMSRAGEDKKYIQNFLHRLIMRLWDYKNNFLPSPKLMLHFIHKYYIPKIMSKYFLFNVFF